VAAPNARRFHGLAKRILAFPHPGTLVFGRACRPAREAARLFDPVSPATAEQIDSVWLARPELRSSSDAARYLERGGFDERTGTLTALFVDNRCGLISSDLIGAAAPLRRRDMVRRILGRASSYHAHGVILATNDPKGEIASTAEWHELTSSLSSKAEATGISLLNHLVLTAEGWKTIYPESCSADARVPVDNGAAPRTSLGLRPPRYCDR